MAIWTKDRVKRLLLGLLPKRFVAWFDFSAGGFGDEILDGAAEQWVARVTGNVEDAQANACPLTLTASGLAAWEAALQIYPASTATTDTRRAAIISKLREYGSSNEADIRAIVAPLLGCTPAQLTVVETPRAGLTTAHTYSDPAGFSITGGSSDPRTLDVRDDGLVSEGGALLTVTNLVVSDPTDAWLIITGPDSTSKTVAVDDAPSLVLFLREFIDKQVMGAWTVEPYSAAGDMTADSIALFVEGIGRDSAGGDGLGAGIFYWNVLVDPADTTVPDYAAADRAIARVGQAHTDGGLVFVQTDGDPWATVEDDNCIADRCLCD